MMIFEKDQDKLPVLEMEGQNSPSELSGNYGALVAELPSGHVVRTR
jgi:hypothetical protein